MDFNSSINTVITGDCLEVMKQWPDKCVDLVLTDPPYGHNNNNNNDVGGDSDGDLDRLGS